MKRFFRLPTLVLLAASLFLVNACTTDETPDFVLPPTINFNAGTDLLTGDATLSAGAPIKVQITASKGDNDMQFVEFLQDGVRISDFSRISINGTTATSNAPLLSGDEVSALTWDVEIITDATEVSTYTISVSDAAGNADQASLTITIDAAEPTLTFVGIGSSVNVMPNTWHLTKVTVATNGSPLVNISVWEDGALVTDLTRLGYGDITNEFATNPLVLSGDDVNGLTEKEIYIKPDFIGSAEFTIQVENAAGKTAAGSFTMVAGTPVDDEFTAVLVSNADGPNQGGLNLYNGMSVPSASADAQLRDLGIDINEPAATNWIQKVESVNASSMRELSAAQIADGISYESSDSKELITFAWDNAVSVTQSTNQIQVGDTFLISQDNDFFIIKCVEVNVVETDNTDNYKFDVKQALF